MALKRRINLGGAQSVPLREPTQIIAAKPCPVRFILPNQCLQRQIDSNHLIGLHQRRATFGIANTSSSVGRSGKPASAAPAA